MTTQTVTVTVEGIEYTATVALDGKVRVSADGHWAGDGKWHCGQIVDCAADLSPEVYDALDEAIEDLLVPRGKTRHKSPAR